MKKMIGFFAAVAVTASLVLPLWALFAAQQQVDAQIEALQAVQSEAGPNAVAIMRSAFMRQQSLALTQMLSAEFEQQAFATSIFALISSVAPGGLFFEELGFDFSSGKITVDGLFLDKRAPDIFWKNLTQQPALKEIKLRVPENSGQLLLPCSVSATLRRD